MGTQSGLEREAHPALVLASLMLVLCGCTKSAPQVAPDRVDGQRDLALRQEEREAVPVKPGDAEAESGVGWCEPFLASELERRIARLEVEAPKGPIDPEQADQQSSTLFHKAIIAGRLDL